MLRRRVLRSRSTMQVESGDRMCIGRGSATPLPGYSLDTLAQAESAFGRARHRHLPWSLPGVEATDGRARRARLAHLPPSARAAIEVAILDTAGQIVGRPLWALLRAVVPPSLPLCAFLPPQQIDSLASHSAALCQAGITSQKWKLTSENELDALARLPRDRVRLRLDANRQYSPEVFAALSGRLAALEPQFIEEPIQGDLAAWILGAPATALRELRFATDESLAALRANESLASLRRFSAAIAGGRLSTVVVKPARDGFLGALALGRAARAAGADVVVTHMWDAPRGHVAAAHLAFALGVIDAQGLAAHPGLGDPSDPSIAALHARFSKAQLPRAIGARARRGSMMRPLVVTRSQTIDRDALARDATTDPSLDTTPLVIRGAPRLDRALPILRAIASGRSIAPIDEDAPARHRRRTSRTPRIAERAIVPSLYLSTSGSTGTPTLAALDAAAWRAHADAATEHLQLAADDRWLCTLPLSHTGGLSILLRCRHARRRGRARRSAATRARCGRLGSTRSCAISTSRVCRSCQRSSISWCAPACVRRARSRSVLLGGQALDDVRLASRARDLGWPLVASYGLTETCGMCGRDADQRDGLASAARHVAAPGRPRRRRRPPRDRGTTAMARRLHGSDRIDGGWLRTFDRARLDVDALTVLGRADDVVIISAGHKIDPYRSSKPRCAARRSSPTQRLPAIPDPAFGASLAAIVVLRGSHEPSAGASAALEETLATLPRHARPRRFVFADALPRLASGKLDRLAIRRTLEAQHDVRAAPSLHS